MTERAMSLHVGLNRVDPVHYAGWKGELQACENDARDMAAIAEHQGFEPAVLLTRAATYEAVLGAIRRAAGLLQRGDSFLLTFAGHGAQLPGGDPSEDDGLDETVVLFDRMLRDDELGTALRTFRPGVRLVVVSDSCHSGTVVRDRLDATGPLDVPRFMPQDVLEETLARHPELYSHRLPARDLSPDVLLLSAAQDDETAADGRLNGLFTGVLKSVWNRGAFVGDHVQFRDEIERKMPASQRPNLLALGPTGEATRLQRPFGIAPVPAGVHGPPASAGNGGPSTATAGGGTQSTTTTTITKEKFMSINTMQGPTAGFDPSDNWSEVAEELRLRLGVDLPQADFRPSRTTNPTPVTDDDGNGGAMAHGFVPAALDTRGPADDITVRAFWWGFHIQIGHQALERILTAADGVNALVGSIGGAIPSPAQPWIVLIAKFVVGVHALLRQLDHGNGVYISMSWFAPGAFVPTTVPDGRVAATSSNGREAAGAAREVQPLYEPLGLTVNESDPAVDTGLYIQPGQRVVISADGQIWAGVWATGTNGPEGWTGWSASANSPLPYQAPFALLARLDGRYFLVGRGASFIHRGGPSKLYLRINDDRPGNGWGSFQVRVEVYAS
ncbi:hypothetical protein GCM10009712_17230 [Pseudarthrobacter sulfonivorans]|uniref:caspase family protein n=1 Tax=Pseudarthrobacter sulfonivorans TaxID=121292 RepID=UPI00168BA994|nr:caspase family protein [Pseudarthrobacter sulfonivorans]